MKLLTLVSAGILGTLGLVAFAAEKPAVLGAYEKVTTALVADDLAGARKAATELAGIAGAESPLAMHASELSESDSLETARDHFNMVSQEAIKLAKGQKGWNVITCPMAKADWLQRGGKVANPYMGQKMPGCGAMKKDKSAMKGGGMGGCCSTMRHS